MEKKKFKRVYHPYWEWEEVPHNMWGTVENKKEWVQRAIEFTGNHNLYGSYMMRVIQEWPISCENALTDSSLNRRAWVGHAAVALALQCPEDIVRVFTTRASAGIGLGLFLVEGIVRAHAGSVTLGASGGQGGEGASFRLDLPLEVASDQGEGPATPLARVAAG
jgi:hypothetical protein